MNMKVLIVEDEYTAANNLVSILNEIDSQIEVLAIVESVKDLFQWLKKNQAPDLGFFDIQLSDNNVFEIFSLIEIEFPVIFTTAYSEYAIKAFKVNSIDYILKPLSVETVKFGIDQYKSLDKKNESLSVIKLKRLLEEFTLPIDKNYKKSFLVHYKDRLIPVETMSFSYFYINHGIVNGVTATNDKYSLDYSLEELENMLDPCCFQRVNRQYIVNRKYIKEIGLFFNSRYSIKTSPASPDKIIMSKIRSSQIRKWLET